MFSKIFRFFWPVVTHEWCVIGNTIGRHHWRYDRIKCKNGTPTIAGGFLHVLKFNSREEAEEACMEMQAEAEKFNQSREQK